MPLWNVMLLFMLLLLLVAYQLYRREEGFTGRIRQTMRPILRNMRRKKDALSHKIAQKYRIFKHKYL